MPVIAASAHDVYDSGRVPRAQYACDAHTHTLFSRHAYSTIGECVAAARLAGLELMGSTDHYSCMISASPQDSDGFICDYQHFFNFAVWPRIWDGVRVLRGVEADIVDLGGHLFGWDITLYKSITGRPYPHERTLREQIWGSIDYAIASIHNSSIADGATIGQTTDMYVQALDDPKVLILGHPGRAGVPFDLDTVLLAAKERGKLIEINEHSFSPHYPSRGRAVCERIAERCAELGVMISTGSDAHVACDVGRFDATHELLSRIHFPEELIATRSASVFLDLLERSVVSRPPGSMERWG